MFKKKVIARALAVTFSIAAASVAMLPEAYAQSNTTGTIHGQVAAGSGASILVEGVGTGFRRNVTVEADGRYQVLSLPPGDYKVSLIRSGKVERSEDVSVSLASSTEANFGTAERIQVTGRASRIDVTSTNVGATFTARDLERLPVAQNVGAIIQLAPSTVPGDPRYGGANNGPSFGGASGSENAYFINGFPVTNPLTQVGFQQLPFGAIADTQILSGGYGAEFGRSTGGVVNITTKRGTNTTEAGASFQWAPNSLRAKQKDIVFPNGTMYRADSLTKTDQYTVGAYVGGAAIKDKLFFFVAAEQNKTNRDLVRLTSIDAAADTKNGFTENKVTNPRLYAKVDWNLTENHHLELTMIRETPEESRQYYGFNYATMSRNNVPGAGVDYKNYGPTPLAAAQGGDLNIIKYTGNLTDNLTITALHGETSQDIRQNLRPYDPTMPLITFTATGKLAGLNYVNNQPVNANVLADNAYSKTKGDRLDLEYKVNEQHTVRGGLDYMKLTNFAGQHTPGGTNWRYSRQACTSNALASQGGVTVAAVQANALKDAAGNCYLVRWFQFSDDNPAAVDQSAQYIEDRWQVTNRLLVTLGLRNEEFKNYDDRGNAIISQTRQLEPRLAAAYDMNGDGSTKLFGTTGRYHLQVPANVALRGIGPSKFLRQYFAYTGIDPKTGAPTGQIPVGAVFSPDGETGAPKLPGYAAASDLKSHYQDEFALGFEKAVSKSLNAGVKLTYRQLKSTIEDWCDARPFDAWAAKNGVNTDYFHGTGAFANKLPGDVSQLCHIVNPGVTNTFDMDLNGDGKPEHIVLTPTDMGGGESSRDGAALQKPDRKYVALDFFAEHPYDGKWYGKVNYTWSRSTGNTEGQLNSDLGQADPATTQAYDFKEIQEYASGRLPNDRRHVIKAFGFYTLTPEWAVGGNLTLASGRPKGCLGYYVDPNNGGSGYGDSYRYCNLSAADLGNGDPTKSVPVPRGSLGDLPWTRILDMNVTYKPQYLKGVSAKLDVFNVFNSQEATYRQEQTDQVSPYGTILGYGAPRSAKISLQYDKKF